jgi:hypothetical protein
MVADHAGAAKSIAAASAAVVNFISLILPMQARNSLGVERLLVPRHEGHLSKRRESVLLRTLGKTNC